MVKCYIYKYNIVRKFILKNLLHYLNILYRIVIYRKQHVILVSLGSIFYLSFNYAFKKNSEIEVSFLIKRYNSEDLKKDNLWVQ